MAVTYDMVFMHGSLDTKSSQLTTVGRDMAKHHDLLGARLSHTDPPTVHSSARIRSATEIAKMGCTCTVETTEQEVMLQ